MKTIERSVLKRLIDEGKTSGGNPQYLLIDVRESHELKTYGFIKTAHNLPLSEFENAFTVLESDPKAFKKTYGFVFNKESNIIFYCRTGGRSGRAALYAEAKGYNPTNYAGSVQDWSKIDDRVKMY